MNPAHAVNSHAMQHAMTMPCQAIVQEAFACIDVVTCRNCKVTRRQCCKAACMLHLDMRLVTSAHACALRHAMQAWGSRRHGMLQRCMGSLWVVGKVLLQLLLRQPRLHRRCAELRTSQCRVYHPPMQHPCIQYTVHPCNILSLGEGTG